MVIFELTNYVIPNQHREDGYLIPLTRYINPLREQAVIGRLLKQVHAETLFIEPVELTRERNASTLGPLSPLRFIRNN
ncbi:MAG: hypothetical protein AAF558_06245 [Verrucomicrobiota bacterium]